MLSEISSNQVLLTTKPTESRWLAIANLPHTATEDTIKECFQRYGRIQSIRIDEQRFAFVGFLDRNSASRAHREDNILDDHQLRTAFHDGSTTVPQILLETSPITSSIIEPSPPSITSLNKAIITTDDERDKRMPRSTDSPEENARYQVVPIKRELNSPRTKRKTSPTTKAKATITPSSSSSESERCHHHSSTHKSHPPASASKRAIHSKTRVLKIYHLPSKLSRQTLRDKLRKVFTDFKKPSHLLTIKMIDDYALLTFQQPDDVDKALAYMITKSINGIRLKAEPYDNLGTEKHRIKPPVGADLNEYAIKATRTLYIGNLHPEVSHHELRQICSEYGEIIEIEIKRQQPQASHSQIFAFIQYSDIKSVVRAMKALKTKIIRDRSVKFGFGKSQPTNVLWLDELPLTITEIDLRAFFNRLTNVSSEKLLDIYIDYRTVLKNPMAQCLAYFSDVVAAQNSIDVIRGKRLDSKRVQVDFASKVLIARFSDVIEQTNEKKMNDSSTNRSYSLDRRYSKVSDAESTLTISNRTISSRHPSPHHSPASSDHSSLPQKKPLKSESTKDTNTERIFDWLMQSNHTNVTSHEQKHLGEKQYKSEIIPGKSHHPPRRIFQTRIIPLEADLSFAHGDVRSKVYASMSNPLNRIIHLPLPRFANTLSNPLHVSVILNPKAHIKHLSVARNTQPTVLESNNKNEDVSPQNELDERIRLLDKQIGEINRKNSLLLSSAIAPLEKPSQKRLCIDIVVHAQHASSTAASQPLGQSFITNARLTTAMLHPPTPPSLISPPLSIPNQPSPPLSTDKPTRTTSSTASDLCNNSPIKLLERLGPSAKIKQKPIPPPLSVITTLPTLSNSNYSPMFLTPKSSTPSSASREAHYSPQPAVLKSILKQPSTPSPLLPQETRKAVHIVSTDLSQDDKNKPGHLKNDTTATKDVNMGHIEEKNSSSRPSTSVNSNHKPLLGKIPKKSMAKLPEPVSKMSRDTKPTSATMKHLPPKTPHSLPRTSINRPKTMKSTTISNEIRRKPSSMTPPKKTSLLNNNNLKSATPQTVSQSIPTTKLSSPLKIKHNSMTKSAKKSFLNRMRLKPTTCMYDRIKNRARNDQIRLSLLSAKIVNPSDKSSHGDTQLSSHPRLKRSSLMLHSSDSEDDGPAAKTKVKERIFGDNNIDEMYKNGNQRTDMPKLNPEELTVKKIFRTCGSQKHSLVDEPNGLSKKKKRRKKLPPTDDPLVQKEQFKESNQPSKSTEITPLIEDTMGKPKTDNPISLQHRTETTRSPSPSTHEDKGASSQVPSPKTETPENLAEAIVESVSTIPEIQAASTPRSHTPADSVHITSQFLIDNIDSLRSSPEQQHLTIDQSTSVDLPVDPGASCLSSFSIKNEAVNYFESHPPTPVHLFPTILTPDTHSVPSHHPHFPYPLFMPPPPDSPPLSARTPSTSSSTGMFGASFYTTILSGQQYCYEKESRRNSIAEFCSTPSDRVTSKQPSYLSSDSIAAFPKSSELFNYLGNAQQMYNSLYHFNDVHSFDSRQIEWEGYITLKTDQVFVKTQLIVGNPQIARLSINYWNSDLHQHLRISQRMRLEKIQLDGVQQHMQIDKDYCILIAEAHGFTPDEIRCEQNRLKNGVIQYLNEKQAAGIINISLPGVVQPVYVVHIFPPCEFASEVLQKRAPDAYRCVVQNRLEQIYLLFVITTTV